MCKYPLRVKLPYAQVHSGNVTAYSDVPCGTCPECTARKVSQWSWRAMQQQADSYSSYFETLTYDSEYLPHTKQGLPTLSTRDLQLFSKRLRHLTDKENKRRKAALAAKGILYFPRPPIKYIAAGEYGSNTLRPHYHVILFNAELSAIHEAWTLGRLHVGTVTASSVAYTLKYISKKTDMPHYMVDHVVPEFRISSQAIGTGYLTAENIAWHRADLFGRYRLKTPQGQTVAMPRYMADKIYTTEQRAAIAAHFMYHHKRPERHPDELARDLYSFKKQAESRKKDKL